MSNGEKSLKWNLPMMSLANTIPSVTLITPSYAHYFDGLIHHQELFEHNMQYARLPDGTLLKKAYKSPNSALNEYHCQEEVACDIVYADIPGASLKYRSSGPLIQREG
jgi:hypothetical protein